MFVCLEVNTEDIQVWAEIDNILSRELGLTHAIWGVLLKDNSTTTIGKLPGNLYHTSAPLLSTKEMNKKIDGVLNSYFEKYGSICISIEDTNWSKMCTDARKSAIPIEEPELASRED